MKNFRGTVTWLIWVASWVATVWLFSQGQFWSGVGCGWVSLFMLFAQALGTAIGERMDIENLKKEARDKAYKDELERLRTVA